jgi:hypothetical protein
MITRRMKGRVVGDEEEVERVRGDNVGLMF